MELTIVLLNFAYAALGAVLTILFMAVAFRVFNRLTPFDAHDELAKRNIAVGIVSGASFVAVGIAMGLVIGMGLN